jgi:hypothetical protein
MKYSLSPSFTICFASSSSTPMSAGAPPAPAAVAVAEKYKSARANDRCVASFLNSCSLSLDKLSTSLIGTCANWAIFSTRLIVPTTSLT